MYIFCSPILISDRDKKKEDDSMNEKQRKLSIGTSFALASAWFGTHCGSGFATGAQATSFWVKYGAHAIYLPIISAIIMAAVAVIMWELIRLTGSETYRQYADELFRPYHKVFGLIYEILFIGIMVMGVSAVFAGAGELMAQALGWNYVLCVILFIALTVVLTMFGSNVIRNSASVLSTILIVVIAVCTIIGMRAPNAHLGEVVRTWDTEYSAGSAIWSAILYASFQCVILGSTVNMAGGLKTTGDVKASGLLGFAMNCVMMVLLTYMLLSFYPETTGETLAVLAILNSIGKPWLATAYSLMLFLAFITTAISCIGSLTTRFELLSKDLIKKDTVRRFVFSLGIILICFGLAQFGLLNIIKKGYNAVGYLGIPFVILPTLILGPMKIKKLRAQRSEETR